jgi:hypothetical protein
LFTKHKVHRILVVDEIPESLSDIDQDIDIEYEPKPEPKGRLVSQTDVTRFLLENNHALGSILDRPALEIAGNALKYPDDYLDADSANRLRETPASVTFNKPAWAALQKMSTTHASSVAVVGKSLKKTCTK